MTSSLILIVLIVFFVILAGLFAGAETGVYQLSRVRLRLGIEKRRLSSVILGEVMHDSSALLLTMLVGNNLAHYLVTSIVTVLLFSRLGSEHSAELLATLLTAPVLFVFSELIPKNIFYYRADVLMPYCAAVLFAFHKLFSWCGIVALLKNLSRIFARLGGLPVPSKMAITAVQQPHIRAVLRDTQEEGFLSPVQAGIINRLAGISSVSMRSVMTPISKTRMVDVNSDRSALLKKLKNCTFTRLLVSDGRRSNIIGFINIYEVLSRPEEFADLRGVIKPIQKLAASTSVIDAINAVRGKKQKIALVTRAGHAGKERPVGIVTMKDLVEELLGELAVW